MEGAYAAPFHKLYVSDERGKAEAIVDVQQDKIIKTLHFESETGMPQDDPVARKVYVNLQDRGSNRSERLAAQSTNTPSRNRIVSVFERRQGLQHLTGPGLTENRIVLANFPVPENQHALSELRDVVLVRDQHDS